MPQGAGQRATVSWQTFIKVGFGPDRGEAARDAFDQFARLAALRRYDLRLVASAA